MKRKPEWKLVTDFSVAEYRCGLRAGNHIRLKSDIVVKDVKRRATGAVHKAGEVWTVLSGAKDDPGVLRLQQADGKPHFWDDDMTVFDKFDRI
jgi:hypothetical protein